MKNTATLLINCPDRKGLVARVSGMLYAHGANITHADQHQDHEEGLFFMRVEWIRDDFDLDSFRADFAPLALELGMEWRVGLSSVRERVAIFVSKQLHCLVDLLHRHQAGELPCVIPLIVSNHPDARALAGFYGIPFHQAEMEQRQLELLDEHGIELVVLARYMQILSPAFVERHRNR